MNTSRPFSRRSAVAVGLVLLMLCGIVAGTGWALTGGDDTDRATASAAAKRKAKRKRAPTRLPATRLQTPADGQTVQSTPTFTWARQKGAARYEFQLAADPAFESIVDQGSFQTRNTAATVQKTFANSTYHWRVRAIDAKGRAGRWSPVRALRKQWTAAPELIGPAPDSVVDYPSQALVLQWTEAPRAYKYLVTIATDPALSSSVLKNGPVETSATKLALPTALAPGRYYWAVTPLDAEKHKGAQSQVWSFEWRWPSRTSARVTDLNDDARIFDPQFSWDPVPGAARYEVEVNPSRDWAVGARACCTDTVTGTSFSPREVLPNNDYYWRVRPFDVDGNAGEWTEGPAFRKDFDPVTPSIPNLRLRDNLADPAENLTPALAGPPTTSVPAVTWDPVPGASSYEVMVVPFQLGICNWSTSDQTHRWVVQTATTAWTPLSPTTPRALPGGVSYPTTSHDSGRALRDGHEYCVRVLARSNRDSARNEVVSAWTYLGGAGQPAFRYDDAVPPPPTATSPVPRTLTAADYVLPQHGTSLAGMPLFTWRPVPDARRYFVVVARDAAFTQVVDVGFTSVPAYAPRDRSRPTTYSEENEDSPYHWVVLPARDLDGNLARALPDDNEPRLFRKRTPAPRLLAPGEGSDVLVQPTFRWTAQTGARDYRIQVAQDPSFGKLIEDVVTSATSYTAASTYPADSRLYWRVRGNDELQEGLAWSATGMFQRRLPAPVPAGDTPTSGETIPVLRWSPVAGAVSYDLHVDQADGTKKDFNLRSTAFAPVAFYGTGVWNWQVRARFPNGRTQTVAGGYSGSRPFTRHIATPRGLTQTRSKGRLIFSWEPASMAKGYRVQVSDSSSFARVQETVTTDNTSYAPRLERAPYTTGGSIYWRVATTDEGNNLGGFATNIFHQTRRMQLRVAGRLRRGSPGRIVVRLTSGRKAVGRATVRVAGVGVSARKRTSRKGVAVFRVVARTRGTLRVQASRSGFATAKGSVRVRG